jgi:hypothetical protein
MRVANEINILHSYHSDPTFDLTAQRGWMKLYPTITFVVGNPSTRYIHQM